MDFLNKFITLANGIASHDTFGRVFSLIDSTQLEELLIS
ncbi:MAG: transposase family protein [Francisellaceae bacterium]|nr:transposase family protein [Francisellaceae bacterium]MBT6207403.1 transposase family protein [Francisellaceae bacterium]MBT6539801.1 transposase family protein [Francisellaceae bacterium]